METSLSITDGNTHKIDKKIEDSNKTRNLLEPSDIHRTLQPTKAEHTFFSNARETFSRTRPRAKTRDIKQET